MVNSGKEFAFNCQIVQSRQGLSSQMKKKNTNYSIKTFRVIFRLIGIFSSIFFKTHPLRHIENQIGKHGVVTAFKEKQIRLVAI